MADRAGLREIGARARHSVLSLDWERIVDAVEVEYASAMAAPGLRAAAAWKPALPVV